MRTYRVVEHKTWPCCWYGGPFWNDRQEENSPLYYFRTEKEAKKNVERLRKQAQAAGEGE